MSFHTDDTLPSPLARLVLAAAGGDAPAVTAMIAAHPELVDEEDEVGETCK